MTAAAAYEAGLAGDQCWVYPGDGTRRLLPVRRWLADADQQDAELVAATVAGLPDGTGRDATGPGPHGTGSGPHGSGPGPHGSGSGPRGSGSGPRGSVLDVGCGPGRLTAAVAATGALALGIDISARAVTLARARGAHAVHADVFGPVPRAGHWDRVLLADGNLGIGGDPVALLTRATQLLAPNGLVVADVEPGGGIRRAEAWLEVSRTGLIGDAQRIGGPVPWAWVGLDAVADLGGQAGLAVRSVVQGRHRCVVVWSVAS